MLRAVAAAKKKNDRIDASKICDCLRCDFPPECYSLDGALEYFDGVALIHFIVHKLLPLDQLLGLRIEIMDALVAAHSAGIIHRTKQARRRGLFLDWQSV